MNTCKTLSAGPNSATFFSNERSYRSIDTPNLSKLPTKIAPPLLLSPLKNLLFEILKGNF